jgi:hypothetical protein
VKTVVFARYHPRREQAIHVVFGHPTQEVFIIKCLFNLTFALVSIALLAACAGPVQLPVDLPANYFVGAKAKPSRIGVVMSEMPKPDTQFPGASCLLCLGVANLAHSSLNKEVQAFSTNELKPLPADLVALLQKQGLDAVLINEPLKVTDLPDIKSGDTPNKSRKDFSALKAKHNVDRLLVVHLTSLGVWRSYSAYIPTDLPAAVAKGTASIVDLGNNNLDWYLPINLSRKADGAWDEAPKFPGLSNAYYQVLESVADMVKKPFAK